MHRHYLFPLFNPRSVAVFGASESPGSVGGIILRNLRESAFQGTVHAVNPRHAQVFGQPCHASAATLPAAVDLAVIATPAASVPDILAACGARGIRHAVVLSAGFREKGEAGAALEQAAQEAARQAGVRFLGPNCLGIQRPALRFNATFGPAAAHVGDLALVSQSGAICAAMLDWAAANDVGFSSVVSTGAAADLDFGEILDYLAVDHSTRGILLYIEGIRDARRFMSALRTVAGIKPVILVKVGREAAGDKAARSHTGAMVGADDVFNALVRRAGVVRVKTFLQLFAAARALSSHIRPTGNRLAIITNGGGPGVMATDMAAELGIRLAEFDEAGLLRLDGLLPNNWSRGNPLDLLGDAQPEHYRVAMQHCLADAGVDGVLVIYTPQAATDPLPAADAVLAAARDTTKPVLCCWLGEIRVAEARRRLKAAGMPTFNTPEPAVEVFSYLSAYYENQRLLMQTPGPLSQYAPPDLEGARLVIEAALAEGRACLTEVESKALLAAFHIPVARAMIARSAAEALLVAEQIGFPVAMKINSRDVIHKTDVGGVVLNLNSGQAVRAAYLRLLEEVGRGHPEARLDGVVIEPMVNKPHGRELLVGIAHDAVLGPVIGFGAGGVAVEVFHDREVALPPLNAFLARDLMRRSRVFQLLGAHRDMPAVELGAIEAVLLRVSEMACELPWLRELDINPLLADDQGVLAADARVVVGPRPSSTDRYGHMAIHPYPNHLVFHWQLADGHDIVIRPIRSEDAEIEQEFVRRLSPESKYFRFMTSLSELTEDMLARFTQLDYSRQMAFIATTHVDGREVEIGVARYASMPDGETCEFALVVDDRWQHKGVGHKLMGVLMRTAREKGLRSIYGEVLAENHNMLGLMAGLGFSQSRHPEDPGLKIVAKAL